MLVKRVVIVGGGFGGLAAAKILADTELDLTLIDRRNYHLFQPLLYQVATAGLSPAEIAVPIRAELGQAKNTKIVLGNVTHIDLARQELKVDHQTISYDYLILACGAKHSYFGHPEWEENAPGLKTLEQATEIRRRILSAFELAEVETDKEKQRALLTFVIVGGGPTGVELAGAISEISRRTLQKDFRAIDPTSTRVILIEAGPRVLASFSPKLSAKAARDLESLGVQIWTQSRVTEVTAQGVSLGEERIRAGTVLWAAGVAPSSLNSQLGELDKSGRVIVNSQLQLPHQPSVFVIGDMACAKDEQNNPLPGLAPVAMQQGRYVARLILRQLRNKSAKPFHYFDKGQMATIGKSKAVLTFGRIELSGFIAWLAWLFVHIYYLIGFKNKFFVFLEWTWSYLTFKKGARLIVHKEWRSSSYASQK